MGVNIQFAPIEDKGTGEVSQSLDPITHEADDVDNKAVSAAVDLPESVTHTADALEAGSVDTPDPGPVTTAADWPAHKGEDKAVSSGEVKSTASKAPAKKAPAKKKGA